MPGLILTGLSALLMFLPMTASGRGPSATSDFWSGCIDPWPAERLGSETCWVRLRADADIRLCLPREHWSALLAGGSAGFLCREWKGKWVQTAQLRNDPHRDRSERKPFQRVFKVRHPGSPLQGIRRSGMATLGESAWRRLERARENASQVLAAHDELGVLRSLAVHERVPGSPGGMLRLLGFVHLLTATGIHLYALSDGVGWITARGAQLAGISPRLALRAARLFSLLSWLSAWCLAGLRPGMLRPWIVVLLRRGAIALGFRWTRWSPLILALAVDAAVGALRSGQERDALAHGRWLYALCVGGGLIAMSAGQKGEAPWRSHFRLAVGSWVFAGIHEAWTQGTLAPGTPVLSLLTIPLFCSVVYPTALLAAFSGTSLSGSVLDAANSFLKWLYGSALSVSSLWVLSRNSVVLGLLIAIFLFVWKPASLRWNTAVLGALLLVRGALGVAEEGTARGRRDLATVVEQLDVGQGDAALVISETGEAGLIDAGDARALSADRWVQLLASRGITRLSWVSLSHLDRDHSGGLAAVAAIVPIDCVEASGQELATARGALFAGRLRAFGLEPRVTASGCAPFPALGPAEKPRTRSAAANAFMSSVLVPLSGGGYYLSPGDATAKDEPRIARWALKRVRALGLRPGPRLLKVSHHGSRTSSSPEFLKLLQPNEAWISAGTGNRYGHPAAPVLERLARTGARILRTDRDGAIRAAGVRHPRRRRRR